VNHIKPPSIFLRTTILTLLIASATPIALLLARIVYTRHIAYLFLLWNLALAWMPLLLAILAWQARRHPFLALSTGFLWLLFLPNAPYLVTDLIHLRPTPQAPMWYDVIMLFSFALAGLALGLHSLHLMRDLVQRRFGLLPGWIFALVAATLSGFGIYIGRFLRWNSWEIFLHPLHLVSDVAATVSAPTSLLKLLTVVLLFGTITLVGLLLVPAWQTSK
jgi:uncharacterized membrane protein